MVKIDQIHNTVNNQADANAQPYRQPTTIRNIVKKYGNGDSKSSIAMIKHYLPIMTEKDRERGEKVIECLKEGKAFDARTI